MVERFLRKGSNVYLEGKLQTRKWQDRDGNDRYTTEVVVGMGGQMVMLDGASGDNRGGSNNGRASQSNSRDDWGSGDNWDDTDAPF